MIVPLLVAISLQGQTPSFAAEEPGDDIAACDWNDPEFGTGCAEDEDEEEDGEVRDGTLDSRQMPGDTIAPGDIDLIEEQLAAIPFAERGLRQRDWDFVGPTNVGGRVTDIAPDPIHAGTVYVAVATAGLWKSVDGGVNMIKAWPDNFPQSLGAVTVASNGDIWVGTGEVNPGGGSLSYGGDGLFRSRDAGASWERVGLKGSSTIGAIRFDPRDRRTIYVAAGGSLFEPGGVRGLYKSTNYGNTWRRILNGANDFTGATDIAMDPSNPDKLIVPMWDHHREPLCRCYTGPGTGLFQTTNGGATWTRYDNDRITSLTPGDTIGFASTSNNTDTAQARMGVAISPSNPNRIYVTTGNWSQTTNGGGPTQRGFRGFYRSDDGGATFQTVGNANPGGDTVWTSKIWIDPVNPDRVFIAGVGLRLSENAGATWSGVNNLHADHHAMAWDPTTPGRVYQGNDGGFYWSTGNGASQTWTEANNEPWTQFYTVDVSEQDAARVVGGTQDNGCLRSWDSTGAVPGPWGSYGGCGDGLYTVIDPADHNFVYACSQFGVCARSVNAGNNSTRFLNATTADRRNWQTPVVLDPATTSTVYYGGNLLNRSADRAVSFNVVSPSLSNPESGTDPSYPFGTITTVAISGSVIYAGTDDGWLWGTRDGGATWTRFTDPDLPARWVTRVTVHPTNPDVAYVTYSGLRNADNNAHVLRTTDGGRNWVDITGNLPFAPTQDVIVDPLNTDRIFVASDVGVFVTKLSKKPDGDIEGKKTKWERLGRGLPRAPVNDIKYHAASNSLYAATYGRGVFRIGLASVD